VASSRSRLPQDQVYLDPGDRLSGRNAPPRRCRVLTRWGPGGGPRNVAVRYLDDGTVAVIPFPRRLRRTDAAQTGSTGMPRYIWYHQVLSGAIVIHKQ
jgi:hypothetical protein